jgi:hypothetical protein
MSDNVFTALQADCGRITFSMASASSQLPRIVWFTYLLNIFLIGIEKDTTG